jgi:predicted nucleic acid-binding protein
MIVTPDTNLLIYAHDSRAPIKQDTARSLAETLGQHEGRCIANQVVGEFFSAATRRLKMPRDQAAAFSLGLLEQFPSFQYDAAHVSTALHGASEGVFSYWDGLLLASALSAGCEFLISEDLQDGFHFNNLTVLSPFAPDGTPNPVLMERLAA